MVNYILCLVAITVPSFYIDNKNLL